MGLVAGLFQGRAMRHFLGKAIIASVLIFVGVGSGVYVGTVLSNNGIIGGNSAGVLTNSSYLEIGDTFPDYAVVDYETGQELSISVISNQKPTLLLFVSSACGACMTMAAYMRDKIIDGLDREIQIVMIYDSDELEYLEDNSILLNIPGSKTLGTNRHEQIQQDGIYVTPTLVALDTSGKIKFVMTGFSKNLNAEIINESI